MAVSKESTTLSFNEYENRIESYTIFKQIIKEGAYIQKTPKGYLMNNDKYISEDVFGEAESNDVFDNSVGGTLFIKPKE